MTFLINGTNHFHRAFKDPSGTLHFLLEFSVTFRLKDFVACTSTCHEPLLFINFIFQAFKRRMDSRRNSDVINLLMYLEDPSFTDDTYKKDLFGHRVTKAKIKNLAISLTSRLFDNLHNSEQNKDDENDVEVPNEIMELETEEEVDDPKEKSMSEQLDEYLASSSKTSNTSSLNKKDITAVVKHEMNIFDQTKKHPKKGFLEALYNALLTIPPTSVESERAFSVFGYFCNKIRSSLQPATINALIFLREYYKNTT